MSGDDRERWRDREAAAGEQERRESHEARFGRDAQPAGHEQPMSANQADGEGDAARAAGEAQPPPVPPARCPRCGAELEPDQEWCLGCGTAARTVIAPTPNWRLPIALGTVVAVLCAAALVWAFVALTDNDDDVRAATETATTTSTGATAPVTTAPAPTTTGASTAPAPTAPGPTATTGVPEPPSDTTGPGPMATTGVPAPGTGAAPGG